MAGRYIPSSLPLTLLFHPLRYGRMERIFRHKREGEEKQSNPLHYDT
jgi:hypothetical protein